MYLNRNYLNVWSGLLLNWWFPNQPDHKNPKDLLKIQIIRLSPLPRLTVILISRNLDVSIRKCVILIYEQASLGDSGFLHWTVFLWRLCIWRNASFISNNSCIFFFLLSLPPCLSILKCFEWKAPSKFVPAKIHTAEVLRPPENSAHLPRKKEQVSFHPKLTAASCGRCAALSGVRSREPQAACSWQCGHLHSPLGNVKGGQLMERSMPLCKEHIVLKKLIYSRGKVKANSSMCAFIFREVSPQDGWEKSENSVYITHYHTLNPNQSRVKLLLKQSEQSPGQQGRSRPCSTWHKWGQGEVLSTSQKGNRV